MNELAIYDQNIEKIQRISSTTQSFVMGAMLWIAVSLFSIGVQAKPPCPDYLQDFPSPHYDLYLYAVGSIFGGVNYRQASPGSRFYCGVFVHKDRNAVASKRVMYRFTADNGNDYFIVYGYEKSIDKYTPVTGILPKPGCSNTTFNRDLWGGFRPRICGSAINWDQRNNRWALNPDGSYKWYTAAGYKRTRASWPY